MLIKQINQQQSNLPLSEIRLFYFSVFMMALAESMIAIFVPVYLYHLNYPIWQIVFFYFLVSFWFVVLSFPGARAVAKIGVKYSILFSSFFLIGYYLLLNGLTANHWFYYILPLLLAGQMIFYNYGYHVNFLINSTKKERGRELSILGIVNTVAGAGGPVMAGVLIAFLNFNALFLIGAVLLIIGALLLFMGKDDYEPREIKIKKCYDYFKNKKNWRNFLSFTGYAIEASVNRQIWPIYLIILLVSYEKMGLVVTLSFVVPILAYYLIGNWTDKYDRRKLLTALTGFYFVGCLGRLLVNSTATVLTVDSYRNLTQKFLLIPWEAVTYDLASEEESYLFIVSREIIFNLARVIIMPFIMLIFYLNFYPFAITLTLAALLTLLFPVLKQPKNNGN